MKKLLLVPAFLAAFALPAIAGGSATPNKVTITPAPATDTATAAATVAAAPAQTAGQSKMQGHDGMLDYSAFGGKAGCGYGNKTQALIN